MRADGTAANLAAATDGDPAVASECLSVSGHNSYAGGASPGDTFELSDQGGVFRGVQLVTQASGSSGGGDITYKNVTGESPEINGANLVTGWTVYSGSVYQASVTTEPYAVWIDGSFGDKKTSTGACVNALDWYWASSVLYLYAPGDPDTEYTSPGVEAAAIEFLFEIYDSSYITLDGLKVTKANGCCIRTQLDPSYITIKNCTASWGWANGIKVYNYTGGSYSNIVVEDCIAEYCGGEGINFTLNAIDCTIRRNIARYNCFRTDYGSDAGIKVFGFGATQEYGIGYLIESNESYGNGAGIDGPDQGLGIWMDWITGTAESPNVCRYNYVHDNESHGIMVEKNDYAQVYGNLCVDNASIDWCGNFNIKSNESSEQENSFIYNNTSIGGYFGIIMAGHNAGDYFDNNSLKNNIAISATYANIHLQDGADNGAYGDGNTYDANCFGDEATEGIRLACHDYTRYSTYDTFEAAVGFSLGCVEADPSFSDADNDDFTLASDSPCIGAGVNLGATYADILLPASTWPDGVVTGDQDNY